MSLVVSRKDLKLFYVFRRVERGHGGVHKQSKSPEKEVNHTPPPLEKEIHSWTA